MCFCVILNIVQFYLCDNFFVAISSTLLGVETGMAGKTVWSLVKRVPYLSIWTFARFSSIQIHVYCILFTLRQDASFYSKDRDEIQMESLIVSTE